MTKAHPFYENEQGAGNIHEWLLLVRGGTFAKQHRSEACLLYYVHKNKQKKALNFQR